MAAITPTKTTITPGTVFTTTTNNEVVTAEEVHPHPSNNEFVSVKVRRSNGETRWTSVKK